MAEHSINLGHPIQLPNTSILARKSRCIDQVIREEVEIEFYPNNMNKDDGFSLSKSWKPLICALKEQKQALAKDMHTLLFIPSLLVVLTMIFVDNCPPEANLKNCQF
jgi:hypothetical protein